MYNPNILEQPFDVMISDYLGLWGIRDADLFGFYKCRIRILDSFGTDPLCKYTHIYTPLVLSINHDIFIQ